MDSRLCEGEIEEIWLDAVARHEAARQGGCPQLVEPAPVPDSAEEYLADAWAMVLGACVLAGLSVVLGLLLAWWALHV